MPRKTAGPSLAKIFRGYPYAFFPKFSEAVEVAKLCPEGSRVVWRVLYHFVFSSRCNPWRVGRVPEAVARDLADNSESIKVVWKDGQLLVDDEYILAADREAQLHQKPLDREKDEPEPMPQKAERQTSKKSAGISIPALIESLKAEGISAERILEIIAESTR